jgi:hypothetical protein
MKIPPEQGAPVVLMFNLVGLCPPKADVLSAGPTDADIVTEDASSGSGDGADHMVAAGGFGHDDTRAGADKGAFGIGIDTGRQGREGGKGRREFDEVHNAPPLTGFVIGRVSAFR